MVSANGQGVRRDRSPPWRRASPRCGAVRADGGAGVRGRARGPRGPSTGPRPDGVAVLADPAGRLRLHLSGNPPRRRSHPRTRAHRAQGAVAAMSDPGSGARPGPGDEFPAKAAAVVRERSSLEPEVAIVLGSGLGEVVAADVDVAVELPYEV